MDKTDIDFKIKLKGERGLMYMPSSVGGFFICCIMNKKLNNCMIDYIIALLDDMIFMTSNKSLHTGLFSRMKQSEISSWSETGKIDWVR